MNPYNSERSLSRVMFCTLETYSLVGGLQNFNKRVVRNLIARAIERGTPPPHIITLRDSDIRSHLGTASGRSFPNRLSYFAGVARALLSPTEILIIGHINLMPLAIISRVLRPRLRLLLVVHGDEAWNSPNRRPRKWYEPHLLRLVDRIASVSQFTANIMSREFRVPRSKFLHLPNAVDPLDPTVAKPQEVNANILTVTRLGAGDRPKNVDQMLKATALLKRRGIIFKYVIVGEGALRTELEQLARDLDIDDRVEFLGRVDDATLDKAYAQAAIFALPSSKEGFGIVYLEAWQHAIPVLCSTEGASSEIVEDGHDGFVVPPNEPQIIADRLSQLLTDSSLARRMGAAGRDKVQAKYLNTAFRANLDSTLDHTVSL